MSDCSEARPSLLVAASSSSAAASASLLHRRSSPASLSIQSIRFLAWYRNIRACSAVADCIFVRVSGASKSNKAVGSPAPNEQGGAHCAPVVRLGAGAGPDLGSLERASRQSVDLIEPGYLAAAAWHPAVEYTHHLKAAKPGGARSVVAWSMIATSGSHANASQMFSKMVGAHCFQPARTCSPACRCKPRIE